MAAIRRPERRRARTSGIESWTRLAFWLQTCTQLPQPMQRSRMTSACPFEMRMALAGQSRTQV